MASLEGLFSGIVINGSRGKGGGQMLRLGMALSMMFGITLKFVTGWAHDEAQGREASVSQDCGLNSPRNFAPRFGPVF